MSNKIYPGIERKKIFYFMSRAKYPNVDKMIKLHRQKKLKQKPKTTNPINIEIPPASFEEIPHPSLTLVGAFQQGPTQGIFEGVEESKETDEVAVARIVDGLEGITLNDKGKLLNPHSGRYIENTQANKRKIRAPPPLPRTPKTPKTPSSPAEQKSQQREKKRGRV